jgi:hypothetical protein
MGVPATRSRLTLWLATFTATDGSPWGREIDDRPSAESKLYQLPQMVLFAILALVAGANSYRTIHSFIDVHLRDAFGVTWRGAVDGGEIPQIDGEH